MFFWVLLSLVLFFDWLTTSSPGHKLIAGIGVIMYAYWVYEPQFKKWKRLGNS